MRKERARVAPKEARVKHAFEKENAKWAGRWVAARLIAPALRNNEAQFRAAVAIRYVEKSLHLRANHRAESPKRSHLRKQLDELATFARITANRLKSGSTVKALRLHSPYLDASGTLDETELSRELDLLSERALSARARISNRAGWENDVEARTLSPDQLSALAVAYIWAAARSFHQQSHRIRSELQASDLRASMPGANVHAAHQAAEIVLRTATGSQPTPENGNDWSRTFSNALIDIPKLSTISDHLAIQDIIAKVFDLDLVTGEQV